MRLADLIQKQSGERISLLSRPDSLLSFHGTDLRFSLSNEVLALGQKAHMMCKKLNSQHLKLEKSGRK